MALAADRNTKMMDGGPMPATLSFPVKTGVTIYKGALVGIDTTTGYLVPATAATTICIVGRAEEQIVAGASASGTYKCAVKTGVHKWANSTVAACAITHVGTMVYAEDDQTISQTSQANTLSQAGLMIALDADGGVWVCSGPYPYQGVTYVTTAAAQTLTNKTLTAPVVADFTNAAHDHGDADDGGKIVASGVAAGTAYQVLRTNVGGTASEWGGPMALTPAADLPPHVANDIIPPAIVSGAIYDIPALDAGSTITLPAAALDGTYCYIRGDGVKNDQTIQIRDATGPTNLTAAVGANKRLLALCVKIGGAWYANIHVSP